MWQQVLNKNVKDQKWEGQKKQYTQELPKSLVMSYQRVQTALVKLRPLKSNVDSQT